MFDTIAQDLNPGSRSREYDALATAPLRYYNMWRHMWDISNTLMCYNTVDWEETNGRTGEHDT